MVKSQLIAGTRNPANQIKVLLKMEVIKTLKQAMSRLLAFKLTEGASKHLCPSTEVAPTLRL